MRHPLASVTLLTAFVLGLGASVSTAPAQTVPSNEAGRAAPGFAAIYYVATNGDDSADGTQAAPWRTIAHAVDRMNAGDTTYVKGGVYNEKRIRFRKSGTAAAPIKLLNAPGESPVIDFGVNKGNRLVQRFEIESGAGRGTPIGWITIEGFEIGQGYEGIKFIGAHDLTIRRNWIHHSIGQGILGSGKDILIDRNVISHNGDSRFDHGLYLSGSNYVISNNLIYANATYGIQVAGYAWEGSAHYKPKIGALPDRSYTGASNMLIANNTFARQGSSGVVIWQADAVNNRVINNVFYDNGLTSRAGVNGVNGVAFLNSGKGHVIDHNLFFATGVGGTRMFANAVEGVHYTQSRNVTADPNFVDAGATSSGVPDFHLKAGSPAIDQGLTLPQVTRDHDGRARPWPAGGAHDIGAYEHGAPPNSASKHTAGPLRVHPANPRYFADNSGRAILLTGAHTWATLQDTGAVAPPPIFDFNAYLDFLVKHGHNFVRLWRQELPEWPGFDGKKLPPLRYVAHHPWRRTGPRLAMDGLPKFDFSQWDEEHFQRLRTRVQAAGRRGVYVSIMLFEGYVLRARPSLWAAHPMNPANNINGIDGDADHDGFGLEVQMLKVPAITDLQRAYIRKVIDTVNDLDNVLYEISNESLYHPDILAWQTRMIEEVNAYQSGKPARHPVGLTNLVGLNAKDKVATNDALPASPAEWTSPGATAWGPSDAYSSNPPATTGKKVEILDSDHTWNNACMVQTSQQRADQGWVWKSFLRGYNPIYMDPIDFSQPDGVLPYAKANTYAIVLARPAMGHIRAYSERMDLAAMTPRDGLASSGYCMASPSREYLAYLPQGGDVSVDLGEAPATFRVEWFNPRLATTQAGERVSGAGRQTFRAPFEGDAVLYLKAHQITKTVNP